VGWGTTMTGRTHYSGMTICGVPFWNDDRALMADRILAFHYTPDCAVDSAKFYDVMKNVMAENETVVNSCGVLVQFNSLAIAALSLIGPGIFSHPWQKTALYGLLAVWILFTMRLMIALLHRFPQLADIGAKNDLEHLCRAYVDRLAVYNVNTWASVILLGLIMLMFLGNACPA
jgi:hypothetical protein